LQDEVDRFEAGLEDLLLLIGESLVNELGFESAAHFAELTVFELLVIAGEGFELLAAEADFLDESSHDVSDEHDDEKYDDE
jgi:hypothetical protein